MVFASTTSFIAAHPVYTIPPDSSDRRIVSGDTVKTIRVTPGIQYDAGWLHRLLAGTHWRDVWTTEISAEVLDLDRFAGGLTPTKKGGGLQTKNLRFIGNDGREYKFRSMNKDAKRSLPPELQESVVADIIQDQISIGNPMASIVVAPLLNEVGVLNAEPRIVVMPRSERLKEFDDEFAGVLGIIEEHPKAGFMGAEKVIDGLEIFEKLENDPDERVDEREFLKARLMDILIGDRDRHADQWRWAGYRLNGKRYWRPIPRDRDYGFGRFDGFFPWASGIFVHSLAGFGYGYPSILELTWIGRYLDRRFLSRLDKPVWDSVAAHIKSKLTDAVLRDALHKMPPEMSRKFGKTMFEMLKSRRDGLHDAAHDFYRLLSDVVDIYGSNKAERAEVKRLNDVQVEVSVYEAEKGELLCKRIFSKEYTSEIRLHLLGGDDVATVEGENSILIRILGGDGNDELVDRSTNGRTEFYDYDKNTKVITGRGTRVELGDQETFRSKEKIPEPLQEDRYRIWSLTPIVNFNSDDGLIIGGGPNITQYGFRVEPYAHYLELTGAYATRFSHYDARFYSDFYDIIDNARVELILRASDLGFTRFYGFGNESSWDKSLAANRYYESNYQYVRVQPTVNFRASTLLTFWLGGVYEYSNVRAETNRFVDTLKPYGLGKRSSLGFSAGCSFDARDRLIVPSKGFTLNITGTYYPKVFTNDFEFWKASADIRGYLPTRMLTDVVFAAHVGGEKTFGTYPFYHASVIGGKTTVRGFARERFAGDASVFGQTEMRIALVPVNIFVPGMLGLSLFGDAGRVFVAGETSDKWHSAFGGGVWLNAVNRFVLNLTVASSPEVVSFYLTSGFMF